jgi:hypothetical protein
MTNSRSWLAASACMLLIMVLTVAIPAAAAPPSAFGPKTAIGQASGGYVGALKVAPLHGKAGAPFTVTGTQLPPNQEFQLVWTTVDGRWNVDSPYYKGRDYVPVAYEMAKVRSDAQGRVQATLETPDDFGFDHDIVLQQAGRLFTQVGYAVDMTVDVSPKSGPAGTPITVTVKGMGSQVQFNSWHLLYDNAITGWISTVTTRGAATFTIPATGHVGDHVLEVHHGQFTFPYRNTQQSPNPDRPTFAAMFTITPGAPVLPAAPDRQAQSNVRVLPPQGQLVSAPHFSGVGEPVQVAGTGLTPGKRYALNWTRVIGNRIDGGGWQDNSIPVAEATAGADGRAAFTFATPDDLGGNHGLWIEQAGAKLLGTHLIKTTALPLSMSRGPAGTTFKIHLKGVGWTETANIMHLVYDNAYVGYACAFNSQGDIEIFMKATGAPGWHFIDLYPGIYKGTETDLSNYRMPQLSYAADHPGEDLPAFHFAFEVTAD